jgi:hypothetical protein
MIRGGKSLLRMTIRHALKPPLVSAPGTSSKYIDTLIPSSPVLDTGQEAPEAVFCLTNSMQGAYQSYENLAPRLQARI